MVNSWAYIFQSMQIDNRSRISGSNSRPLISGEIDENNDANNCNLLANDASVANKCDQSCDVMQGMMQIKSHENCPTENGEYDTSNYIVPASEAPLDMLSSCPFLASGPGSSNALLSGEETCRLDNPGPCSSPCKGLEHPQRQTSLPMTEGTPFVGDLHNVGQAASPNCGSRDVRQLCVGLGAVNSSTSNRFVRDEQIGGNKADHTRNDNILSSSETLCLYDVCADCLQSLHVVTQEILTNCLESRGHSPTVDDVHEIITSCFLNLVAAIRKHFLSESCYKDEECCIRGQGSLTEDCVFQNVDGIKLKKMPHSPSQFEHIMFFPNECSQHQRGKEVSSTRENASDNSPVWPQLKFLFRDGLLLTSNPQEDVILHCNFERLSIQAIIQIISLTNQPYV